MASAIRSEAGPGRGAAVAHREQYALEYFGRLREERERTRELVPSRSDDPWRGTQGKAENQNRDSRGGHDDDHGGKSYTPGDR